MKEMTEEYGIVHKELEPYEVLGTRWLPYEDILKLKMVESMVEVYFIKGIIVGCGMRLCQMH